MSIEETIKRIVPKRLRELRPYTAELAAGLVKMDAMELPFSFSDLVLEEFYASLKKLPLNRYPDSSATVLRERLLEVYNLNTDVDVIVGNGSDELIHLLCLLTAGTGNASMLCSAPTFSVYRIASETLGLRYLEVDSNPSDFNLDIGGMIEVVEAESPSLIFVASPNNPTGNSIDSSDLERLCRSTPGLVVLDEAYWRFSRVSSLELIESHENLLILQTLSKIGFAGLRVGMLYGPKAWVDLLHKIRMPYNVNSLSQAGALFALDHEKLVRYNVDWVIKERDWMLAELSGFENLKVWPSKANFILVRTLNRSGFDVFNELKENGFLVKDMSNSHLALQNCLRITIGNHEENTKFLDKFSKSI